MRPLAASLRSRLAPCLAAAALLAGAPAQTAASVALPVAVDLTNLPAVTFHWPLDASATGYTVARRVAGLAAWSPPVAVPGGGGATSWLESSLLYGVRYEYLVQKHGGIAAKTVLAVGVQAPLQDQRGSVVLLVDASKVAVLGARLDRLVADLVGDGWRVLRHDVAPGTPVPVVKALVAADVTAHSDVDTVFVLGHVPVPYSGSLAPDGHPDHQGAWPADLYYGELHGPWTDHVVDVVTATRPQNRNTPGDGKFDQSQIPSDVDLAVGRVDFHDLPAFGTSEDALLQQYLDKNHDYRHRVFAPDQRAVIDDNFGWFGGEAFAASGWRSFAALVGPANVAAGDYFTSLNAASGNGYAWSYGCGGGSYTSAAGIGSTATFAASAPRGVFTMLFGSYFGDWDSTDNFLRAALGSGWTLASVWAGRPHCSFHRMALGETIGACARASQNDTLLGGYGQRYVHLALLGDPTLRQHVTAPPTALVVTDQWPHAHLAWGASADPVAGYHVYRAATAAGPFSRLSTAPVAATSFVDAAPLVGPAVYMVRAVRHEATPTGTYWNASQGVFAGTALPSQAAAHTSFGAGCGGLQLAAGPAPVSTATAGASITYTVGNVPEASPGSGVRVGLTIVSLQGDLPGTSLAALGMPGCSLWVGALDVTTAFQGPAPVQTTTLALPPGVPPGSEFFATAVALFVPFSLPGGANANGAITSNGVRSFVNSF